MTATATAPDVGACYRAGLLDGAQRAEQDRADHSPSDARADELTQEAKEYGTVAQRGNQSHRAYRALLLGTARGYRQAIH